MSLEMDLGKRILKARKGKALTQAQLAEIIGVTDKAVSKWESGSGLPDQSLLAILASSLDLTIDYLMTGKNTEIKVMYMSRTEACAQNDDITLIEDMNYSLTTKDENGKSLLDYMCQYQSIKVCKYLFDKFGKKQFMSWHATKECIKYDVLKLLLQSGCTSLLTIDDVALSCGNGKTKLSLMDVQAYYGHPSENEVVVRIVEIANLMLESNTNMTCLFFNTIKDNLNLKYAWEAGYAVLIDCAVRKNSPHLNSILDKVDDMYSCNECIVSGWKNMQGYNANSHIEHQASVAVLKQTLDYCLENNLELVERLNNINKKFHQIRKTGYIVSNDEIKLARMNQDKSVDARDITAMQYLNGQIINVENLNNCDNHDMYKYVMSKYPYNNDELFFKAIENKDAKAIFQIAVDQKLEEEVKVILEGADLNTICEKLLNKSSRGKLSLKERIKQLNDRKKLEIEQHKQKHDLSEAIDSITKEQLIQFLENNNEEMLVIKLCVKLEALLKRKYGTELDFEKLINKYEGNNCQYGDFDCNNDKLKLLHKLRMRRNSIVHSEQKVNAMSSEELLICINVIDTIV